MKYDSIESLARQCGFDLAGIASIDTPSEANIFSDWIAAGMAGEMRYLTDHRAEIRMEVKRLLPSAKSVICVAKVYKQPQSAKHVAQYALGRDYHDVIREDLESLAVRLREHYGDFEFRAFVDTAPLLERSYARLAGLGWIGKNTCLINQQLGSWLFLGELITSLPLTPNAPPPDRCGTCNRCIEACPTEAIVPGGWRTVVDATKCISYFTIEHRGPIPETFRSGIGDWIFGCDICQDVCPWNRKSPATTDPRFASVIEGMPLEDLAAMTAAQFRQRFRDTPVWRSKYRGFLRNVAIAMGNSGDPRYRPVLERLAEDEDELVAEHARWALTQTPQCV